MKPAWWLLIISLAGFLIYMGQLGWQITRFTTFMGLFLLSTGAALLVFWFFQRGTPPK